MISWIVRLALAEDRLLPGQHRRDGAVPGVAADQAGVGFGQFPRIGRGLQQRGDPLRLVGRDLRGERLEDQVVLPGAWQHIGVGVVPAGRIAPGCQGDQDLLLLVADAVFGQQLAQFLAADAALASLDPADLGAVAFQDPGRVLERVAQVLPVAAQGGAHEPSPNWRCCDHGESPFGGDVLEGPGRVAAHPTLFNVLVHCCRYQAVANCLFARGLVRAGEEPSQRG